MRSHTSHDESGAAPHRVCGASLSHARTKTTRCCVAGPGVSTSAALHQRRAPRRASRECSTTGTGTREASTPRATRTRARPCRPRTGLNRTLGGVCATGSGDGAVAGSGAERGCQRECARRASHTRRGSSTGLRRKTTVLAAARRTTVVHGLHPVAWWSAARVPSSTGRPSAHSDHHGGGAARQLWA